MRTIISNYVGVVAWVVTLDGLKEIDAGRFRVCVRVRVCSVWCQPETYAERAICCWNV